MDSSILKKFTLALKEKIESLGIFSEVNISDVKINVSIEHLWGKALVNEIPIKFEFKVIDDKITNIELSILETSLGGSKK